MNKILGKENSIFNQGIVMQFQMFWIYSRNVFAYESCLPKVSQNFVNTKGPLIKYALHREGGWGSRRIVSYKKREGGYILCIRISTFFIFSKFWAKSKDHPEDQHSNSFTIIKWPPHQKCVNDEKTTWCKMFNFNFQSPDGKWLHTMTNPWINKTLQCNAIDSAFDYLHMSNTFPLHADRPRFCLLFVSRGK